MEVYNKKLKEQLALLDKTPEEGKETLEIRQETEVPLVSSGIEKREVKVEIDAAPISERRQSKMLKLDTQNSPLSYLDTRAVPPMPSFRTDMAEPDLWDTKPVAPKLPPQPKQETPSLISIPGE